jgi:hypothetical protein
MSTNHERARARLAGDQFKSVLTLLIACVCFSELAWSSNFENRGLDSGGPWFTGTLLSTRGSTVDPGHAVVEPYLYFTPFGGL